MIDIVLEFPYFSPIKSHLPDSYNKAIRNKYEIFS